MAAILKTKGFAFQQLTTAAQNEAIRRVGEMNTDNDYWAESTLEWANTTLEAFGFYNIKIRYTGFWSQGDGASFTSVWTWLKADGTTTAEYLDGGNGDEEKGFAERIAAIVAESRLTGIELPKMRMSDDNSCHYCHENSVNIEFDYSNIECEVDQLIVDCERYEERLTAWCRDLMRWIYRSLEAEYDYQSSREGAIECIEGNDYRFDKSGCII